MSSSTSIWLTPTVWSGASAPHYSASRGRSSTRLLLVAHRLLPAPLPRYAWVSTIATQLPEAGKRCSLFPR
jgi:hypothetical protein